MWNLILAKFILHSTFNSKICNRIIHWIEHPTKMLNHESFKLIFFLLWIFAVQTYVTRKTLNQLMQVELHNRHVETGSLFWLFIWRFSLVSHNQRHWSTGNKFILQIESKNFESFRFHHRKKVNVNKKCPFRIFKKVLHINISEKLPVGIDSIVRY